jgi:TatD DNase family protein
VIDSHTHLDACGAGGGPAPAQLVAAATRVGVNRILTVGQDGETGRAALAAAEAFPQVFAAIGHHPNKATGFDDGHLAEIQALAVHERCRAIGETGLDDFRDYAPRADQERAFHAQIDLARDLGKPLVIHTRAAEDDTIATLRTRAAGLDVILHCFSMPDRLEECLAEGWWISFAGNVTYPKNEDLAAAAERVPDDRLLVETDAPYLTPQPMRKERNQPAYVTETARFVAERRGQDYFELEAIVERNAARLFQW